MRIYKYIYIYEIYINMNISSYTDDGILNII